MHTYIDNHTHTYSHIHMHVMHIHMYTHTFKHILYIQKYTIHTNIHIYTDANNVTRDKLQNIDFFPVMKSLNMAGKTKQEMCMGKAKEFWKVSPLPLLIK